MEQEIVTAVAVLMRNGIQLSAISTSETGAETKLALEFIIQKDFDTTRRHFVKIAFESAWFQAPAHVQAVANGHVDAEPQIAAMESVAKPDELVLEANS